MVYSGRWVILQRTDQEKLVNIPTFTEKQCNLHYFLKAPRTSGSGRSSSSNFHWAIAQREKWVHLYILKSNKYGFGSMSFSNWVAISKQFIFGSHFMTIIDSAHPSISHCSHLLLKLYSGYKYKSLAKSKLQAVQILHICKKAVFCPEML